MERGFENPESVAGRRRVLDEVKQLRLAECAACLLRREETLPKTLCAAEVLQSAPEACLVMSRIACAEALANGKRTPVHGLLA